ncbi:hypothetical protein N0V95_003683 [Ascochyta clinopodiicola]|nr:hypothetical protein N0V95_003683 [Ascochyta clinopodiicola]
MSSMTLSLLTRALDRNGIDPDNINVNTTDPTVIAMSRKYCQVGTCPVAWQTIAYRPNMAGNAVYLVCFGLLLISQIWLGTRSKTWKYMATVCVGILGEMAGYVGRVMLNANPFLMNNFLVNLIPLTIAPALLTAGIYLCLGRVIVVVGEENSRLKPKMYTYTFVGCDVLALVLQAIGGGLAATAKDKRGSDQGVRIMIAGLISQVFTMALFMALWLDFGLRTRQVRLAGGLKWMQPALYETLRATRDFQDFQLSLFMATVLIFIRCIYRVAELWQGFGGHLANHEASFMLLEGPLIILAVAGMTVFHPGRVFGELWGPAGKGERTLSKLTEEGSQVRLSTSYSHDSV